LQCFVAKDGLEALEMLQILPDLPSIVLTDVEMPRMDGYELLASLNREEKLKHIPVVMITSRAGDKHRQKAYDLGVSDYLTKPYEDSMLLEKIKQLTS
jgi:chemosensory pili system protein ChpA (sensor histidine kinase/response regulator)